MNSETIEKAILGIILKSDRQGYRDIINLDEIFTAVTPAMFDDPDSSEIYQGMLNLRVRKAPINIVTLPEELRGGNVDIMDIIDLESEAGATVNYKYYLNLLIDSFARRNLAHAFANASQELSNPLIERCDIVKRIQKTIDEMDKKGSDDGVIYLEDDIKKELEKPEQYKLFETGIYNLDKNIDFCRGDLILINGDPGMGKTSLTLNFLLKAQEAGIKSLYVSLDTAKNVMFNRLTAIQRNKSLSDIKYNRQSWNTIKTNKSIQFAYHECEHVEAIHRAVLRHHSDVIFIDHNLKLGTDQKTQTMLQKYDHMAGYLSSLALKTNTCIFLVCHTNRSKDDKTSLNNIYGSGGWGREAVTALHLEGKKEESVENQYIKLRVLKSRNSAINSIYVRYHQETVTFYDSNKREFDDETKGYSEPSSVDAFKKNKFNRSEQ